MGVAAENLPPGFPQLRLSPSNKDFWFSEALVCFTALLQSLTRYFTPQTSSCHVTELMEHKSFLVFIKSQYILIRDNIKIWKNIVYVKSMWNLMHRFAQIVDMILIIKWNRLISSNIVWMHYGRSIMRVWLAHQIILVWNRKWKEKIQ